MKTRILGLNVNKTVWSFLEHLQKTSAIIMILKRLQLHSYTYTSICIVNICDFEPCRGRIN